jgi:hypothetical protein
MATGSQFESERFQADVPQRKKEKSALSTCLTGCLIAFAVVLIVGLIAGYWVWQNWRGWFANAGSEAIKQGIAQSQLAQQEKLEINVQVDRVADAFRTGKLSVEQLGAMMQKLADSPLMTSIVASTVEAKYLAKSGLSDDEKQQATKTLRRFLRGMVDHKIDEQGVNAAMEHVAVRGSDGKWNLREQVSDEDLRKFLEVAKSEADEAGIPDEPEDFDPSEEVKRVVDEAIGP